MCQDIKNSVGDGESAECPSDSESDDEENVVLKKELPVVTKLRREVVAIRRSTQRRELFIGHCNAAEVDAKMVLRDVGTRWNSTLIMCERAEELKEPFDLTLSRLCVPGPSKNQKRSQRFRTGIIEEEEKRCS